MHFSNNSGTTKNETVKTQQTLSDVLLVHSSSHSCYHKKVQLYSSTRIHNPKRYMKFNTPGRKGMQYRYSTYCVPQPSTCNCMPATGDLAVTVQINPPGKAESAVRCLNTVCKHTPVEWCEIQLSATEIGQYYFARDIVHLGAWLGLIKAVRHLCPILDFGRNTRRRPVFLISAENA